MRDVEWVVHVDLVNGAEDEVCRAHHSLGVLIKTGLIRLPRKNQFKKCVLVENAARLVYFACDSTSTAIVCISQQRAKRLLKCV